MFKFILVTWYTFVPCGLGLMAIMAAVALPSYSEHYPPLNYDADPGPGYSGQNRIGNLRPEHTPLVSNRGRKEDSVTPG